MIIIKTERLILRELNIYDAKPFFDLNSDPEVMKFTGDKPFESIEDAQVFLEGYSDYVRNGFGRWAVISKDRNTFLGWCGLKLNEENCIDLGFRFFKEEWGKGYSTESAKASLDTGFNRLGLTEVIGRAAKENKASIGVLEKLGMEFWKHDNCKGIQNSVYYKISKSAFISKKNKG